MNFDNARVLSPPSSLHPRGVEIPLAFNSFFLWPNIVIVCGHVCHPLFLFISLLKKLSYKFVFVVFCCIHDDFVHSPQPPGVVKLITHSFISSRSCFLKWHDNMKLIILFFPLKFLRVRETTTTEAAVEEAVAAWSRLLLLLLRLWHAWF